MSGAGNNAPNLAALQRDFQCYLLDQQNALNEHIVSTERIDARERLEIYHEAYHLRLTEVLTADFGTLLAVLGDDGFAAAARDYINAHPSQHTSVRWFGRHFAEFIRSSEPWSERPALADLAALDWALSLSFDAADALAIGLSVIAEIPPQAWAGMRFTLHPSVRLIDLNWNAAALRGAVDAEQPLPELEAGGMPVRWLVWRSEMTSMYRSMDVDEAFSLTAVSDGANFGDLCEGLCEWVDAEHAAMHAASMLKQWLIDEMIVSVDLDD